MRGRADLFASNPRCSPQHSFQFVFTSSAVRQLSVVERSTQDPMKRILFSSALAVALVATPAFCQQSTQPPANDTTQQTAAPSGHRHHPFDPQKAAQRIGKKLNLSADQTAKLEPILAGQQQKLAELRSNTSLTPDQRREQFRAIHQDTQSQLAGVLTPDQMQQLRSMRRGPRGKRQQEPGSSGPSSGN